MTAQNSAIRVAILKQLVSKCPTPVSESRYFLPSASVPWWEVLVMKEGHLQWLRGLKLGLLFLLLSFSVVLRDCQGNPPVLEMEGALPRDLVSEWKGAIKGGLPTEPRGGKLLGSLRLQSENEVTGRPFCKWLNKRPRESLLLSYSWKRSHLRRSHSLAFCAEAKRPAPQGRRASPARWAQSSPSSPASGDAFLWVERASQLERGTHEFF